jgi:hypothetical protein
LRADVFEQDLTKWFTCPEAPNRVQNLDAGEMAFGVKFERDTLGDPLARHRGFLKSDANRIALLVVADLHRTRSIVERVDGDGNNLALFLDEDRIDLLPSVALAVPVFVERELQLAFQSAFLGWLPRRGADRFSTSSTVKPRRSK